MVKKIQRDEYLNRYDNMTPPEKTGYAKRVGEWLASDGGILAAKAQDFNARLQNVQAVSVMWNDEECRIFEQGAVLLSAMAGTKDTWLPDMLYVKSAKRAIGVMYAVLRDVTGPQEEGGGKPDGNGTRMQAGAAKESAYTVKAGGATSVWNSAKEAQAGSDKKAKEEPAAGTAKATQAGPVPGRPKHIDQYVHLLPQKTQEHAALVQGLYRELDDARQKMSLLADDPTASAADREAWAKKATKCDNTLRKILDELDAEWAKLVEQGRVVVDDLGNARVVAAMESVDGQNTQPDTNGTELSSEQKARRRDLRKWLVDTRRGNGDTREEHVKKWKENFREYLTLEGDAAFGDEKVMAAVKHYGIDADSLKEK